MENKTRVSKDMYYLDIARTVSQRSTCLRRRYGAIIVKNDEVIATGYNGAPRGEENCIDCGFCYRESLGVKKGERYELCRSVHAEQNAIISAARRDMVGSVMYIVGTNVADNSEADPQPCIMCRRQIINAGITRVVGLKNGVAADLDYTTEPKIDVSETNTLYAPIVERINGALAMLDPADQAEMFDFLSRVKNKFAKGENFHVNHIDLIYAAIFKSGRIFDVCKNLGINCCGGGNPVLSGSYSYTFFPVREG